MTKFFLFDALVCLIFAGCAASVPPVVYEPTATDSVYSFYQNGYALGTVANESGRVVVEAEHVQVAGDDYIRLWLLYYNSSDSPFFLDPMNVAQLTAIGSTGTFNSATNQFVQVLDTIEFEATPPYKILSSIDNQETIAMIAQAINGFMETKDIRPTTITNTKTGETWQVNDTKEKAERVQNRTNASIASTSMIYDLYKQSINAGILKRNTVFPKQSVTGYIYFRMQFGLEFNPLLLKIFAQNDTAKFYFKPVAGE